MGSALTNGLGPSPGGANGSGNGNGDWTDTEKAQIRYRLGLDGTATSPSSAVPRVAHVGFIGAVTDEGVQVDHDYGGAANLAYRLPPNQQAGAGVVRAYLVSDYEAGYRDASFVKGEVYTRPDGTWATPMFLQPGSYRFLYFKPGSPIAQSKAITISP